MPAFSATDWIIIADLAVLTVMLLVTAVRVVAKSLDFVGRPPLARPVFVLGKLSMFACWAAIVLRAFGVNLPAWESYPWSRWAGAVVFTVAAAFVVGSFVSLGDENRFGLPKEGGGGRGIRSGGVYAVSRNPMYVGFILMCVASCLYVPHPINFALAAVMVVVHHVVVIREEEYLDANHQEEWRAYRSRVRRYL